MCINYVPVLCAGIMWRYFVPLCVRDEAAVEVDQNNAVHISPPHPCHTEYHPQADLVSYS